MPEEWLSSEERSKAMGGEGSWVVEKADLALSHAQERHQTQQAAYVALQSSSEKRFIDLEQKCVEMRKLVSTLTLQRDQLKEGKASLETKAAEAIKAKETGEARFKAHQAMLASKQKALQEAMEGQEEATEKLKKKTAAYDILRKEMEDLSASVKKLSEEQGKQLHALNSAKEASLTATEELKKAEEQCQLLKQQNTWFETELKSRTEELMVQLKQMTTKEGSTAGKLQTSETQVSAINTRIADLEKQHERQTTELRSTLAQLKKAKDDAAAVVGQFDKDRGAMKRLNALYQQKAQMAASKAAKYLEEIKGLRTQVQTAEADHAKTMTQTSLVQQQKVASLQNAFAAKISKLETAYAEAKEEVARLKAAPRDESNAGALLSEAAKATSAKLTDLTVTDLMNRTVKAEEALRKSQAENREYDAYLHRILQEIQLKAPLLASQKQDYAQILSRYDKVCKKLEVTITQNLQLTKDLEVQTNTAQTLKDENEKLAENLSLSKKQVHTVVASSDSPSGSSIAEASGGVEALSTADELQGRYNALLADYAKLEKEKVAVQRRETSNLASSETKHAVATVRRELDDLKQERKRQEDMVKVIVAQRDMYCVLLAQAESKYGKPVDGGSPLAVDLSAPSQDLLALEKLAEEREKFDKYKAEKEKWDKGFQEILRQAQDEGSGARLRAEQLRTECAYQKQRYETLEKMSAGDKREVERLKDLNNRLRLKVIDSQRVSKNALHSELQRDLEFKELQQRVEVLKNEKAFLESREAHLMKEIKMMGEERERQAKVLDDMQLLSASVEAREAAENKELLQEYKGLKEKMKSVEETQAAAMEKVTRAKKALEKEVKEVKPKLEAAEAKAKEAKDQQIQSDVEAKAALAKVEDIKSTMAATETRLQSQLEAITTMAGGSGAAAAAALQAELQSRLGSLTEKCEALETAVKEKDKNIQGYASITSAAESALKESQERVAELEAKITDMEKAAGDANADLKKQCEALQLVLRETTQELASVHSKHNEKLSEMQKKVKDGEGKLVSVNESLAAAKATASALEKKVQEANAEATGATGKYKRELQLHAEAVKKGHLLKKQREEAESAKMKAEAETLAVTKQLVATEKTLATQDSNLQGKLTAAEAKAAELASQNAILHDQLQASDTEGSAGGEKDLRDIVAYVRQEKKVVEAELTMTKGDLSRSRRQNSILEQRVAEQGKVISSLEKRVDEFNEERQEQAKFVDKVHQIPTLLDSNKLLRKENEREKASVTRLQKEVDSLRGKLGPLSQKKLQLEAENRELKETKGALEKSQSSLHERVNKIVSKVTHFNIEDHEKLQADHVQLTAAHAKLEGELTSTTAALDSSKKTLLMTKQRLSAEFKAQKVKIEQLTEAKTKAEAAAASAGEQLKKEVAELKSAASQKEQEQKLLRAKFDKLQKVAQSMKKDIQKKTKEAKSLRTDLIRERRASGSIIAPPDAAAAAQPLAGASPRMEADSPVALIAKQDTATDEAPAPVAAAAEVEMKNEEEEEEVETVEVKEEPEVVAESATPAAAPAATPAAESEEAKEESRLEAMKRMAMESMKKKKKKKEAAGLSAAAVPFVPSSSSSSSSTSARTGVKRPLEADPNLEPSAKQRKLNVPVVASTEGAATSSAAAAAVVTSPLEDENKPANDLINKVIGPQKVKNTMDDYLLKYYTLIGEPKRKETIVKIRKRFLKQNTPGFLVYYIFSNCIKKNVDPKELQLPKELFDLIQARVDGKLQADAPSSTAAPPKPAAAPPKGGVKRPLEPDASTESQEPSPKQARIEAPTVVSSSSSSTAAATSTTTTATAPEALTGAPWSAVPAAGSASPAAVPAPALAAATSSDSVVTEVATDESVEEIVLRLLGPDAKAEPLIKQYLGVIYNNVGQADKLPALWSTVVKKRHTAATILSKVMEKYKDKNISNAALKMPKELYLYLGGSPALADVPSSSTSPREVAAKTAEEKPAPPVVAVAEEKEEEKVSAPTPVVAAEGSTGAEEGYGAVQDALQNIAQSSGCTAEDLITNYLTAFYKHVGVPRELAFLEKMIAIAKESEVSPAKLLIVITKKKYLQEGKFVTPEVMGMPEMLYEMIIETRKKELDS